MAARDTRDQDDAAGEPRSADLRDYWQIIRRRWMTVVVVTGLGALLGLGYSVRSGPAYAATSQVVVAPVTQGPTSNASAQASLSVVVNMTTELAVAQSAPVLAQVAKILHLRPAQVQQLAAHHLSITVPATSNVLQITWKARSPGDAQRGANAFATGYLANRHSLLLGQIASQEALLNGVAATLERQLLAVNLKLRSVSSSSPQHQSLGVKGHELTSQLNQAEDQIAVLHTYNVSGGQVVDASLPLAPSGLGHAATLIVGGVVGLMLGLVAAFLRDVFDDRIRDVPQLERKTGTVTLGVLPPTERLRHTRGTSRLGAERRQGVSAIMNPDSRAAEAIGALRATLVAVAAHKRLRTILVVGADDTSCSPLVAELGMALAASGRRVLLVGADMRGSFLPNIFDLPNATGLSQLLLRGGDPKPVIRRPRQFWGVPFPDYMLGRLAVLPSGPRAVHSVPALNSAAMAALLRGERDAHDFVLLDSASATVASGDVVALATQVDGVIVVARQAITKGRALGALRRSLDQVGSELIGAIFVSTGIAGRHGRRARVQPPRAPAAAPIRRPADQAAMAAPLAARRLPAPEADDQASELNRSSATANGPSSEANGRSSEADGQPPEATSQAEDSGDRAPETTSQAPEANGHALESLMKRQS